MQRNISCNIFVETIYNLNISALLIDSIVCYCTLTSLTEFYDILCLCKCLPDENLVEVEPRIIDIPRK